MSATAMNHVTLTGDLDARPAFYDALPGRKVGWLPYAFPGGGTLEPDLDPASEALTS